MNENPSKLNPQPPYSVDWPEIQSLGVGKYNKRKLWLQFRYAYTSEPLAIPYTTVTHLKYIRANLTLWNDEVGLIGDQRLAGTTLRMPENEILIIKRSDMYASMYDLEEKMKKGRWVFVEEDGKDGSYEKSN